MYPKTIDEAYAANGNKRITIPAIEGLSSERLAWLQGHQDRAEVIEAINRADNEGKPWWPNWSNWDEQKWYLWPRVEATTENTAGSGFADSNTYCVYADTTVGFRLHTKTKAGQLHAFHTFPELFITTLLR